MSPDPSEVPTGVGDERAPDALVAPAPWPELVAYRLRPWAPRIVPADARRSWMDDTPEGWAYRCLPMTLANQNGWLLLNPVGFDVIWNGSARTDGLAFRFAKGQPSPLIQSIFGHGIITWDVPYLFRTPPGYNLCVRGPANLIKGGVQALDGLVETDWAVATFTMNWKITAAFRRVRFEEGEPFCMIQPQARGVIDALRPEVRPLESAPELEESYRRWAQSRNRFSAEREAGDRSRWQRHYTRGEAPGGEAAPEHQKKLRVRRFSEVNVERSVGAGEEKRPRRGRTALGLAPEAPWWTRLLLCCRFFVGSLWRR